MLIVDQVRRNNDARLQAVAVVMLLGLGMLLVGLWYVQVVTAKRYQTNLENQTFRTVRIPAVRGKILDRNGLVLADNRPAYSLNLYLEELRPLFEREYVRRRPRRSLRRGEREQLSREVRAAVVSNNVTRASAFLDEGVAFDEREFRRHYFNWPYRPYVVRENLSSGEIARFLEQAPAIPGMDLEIQPLRFYPVGPVVAAVTGYLSRDDLARGDEEMGFSYSLPSYDGAVGLEYAYNEQLRGRPGVKSITVNSLCYREAERIWTTAEPGMNLVLTLDLPLQQAAWEALRSVGAGVRGAVVVLDASNGDVLALVSAPSYDPNEFVAPISHERWAVLNDSLMRPMFNRATQGAYHPGSTFKIVTALACLEYGVLTPGTLGQTLSSPGFFQLGRRRIDDLAPPGDYDFRRAFIRSSNTYFIHYGLKVGRARFLEFGKRFFLGERAGLPTRQEVSGYYPQPSEVVGLWHEGNLANVCIGQEITVTPLQMAVLTAAVANGGRVYYPRFVARLESAEPELDDTGTRHFPPRLRGELGIDARHLEIVREAMLADTVEREATAFEAFHEADRRTPRLKGFAVGGKTGTAEIKGNGLVDKVVWFAAMGPYPDPRYVVVVMVESGASGGGTCAPVARRVFQAIQGRMGSSPSLDGQYAQRQ